MNEAHAYARNVQVTPIKAMFRTNSEDWTQWRCSQVRHEARDVAKRHWLS